MTTKQIAEKAAKQFFCGKDTVSGLTAIIQAAIEEAMKNTCLLCCKPLHVGICEVCLLKVNQDDTKRLDTDDIDILERYPDDLSEKAKGHRHWGRMSWLYPGDIICQVSGKTATAIDIAMKARDVA